MTSETGHCVQPGPEQGDGTQRLVLSTVFRALRGRHTASPQETKDLCHGCDKTPNCYYGYMLVLFPHSTHSI